MIRKVAISIAVLFLPLTTLVFAEQQAVVLVADLSSPLDGLSSIQLKKIYLGQRVDFDGHPIKALRNASDPRLERIFLQSVVSMSKASYDRRLLSLTLRSGTPRPPILSEWNKIIEALSDDPHAVTYAWLSDARKASALKILRVLWIQE